MKSERRRDLLRILHRGQASTQQDLVAALRAAGHDVTQATVSRDLQQLGAVKVRLGDQVAYRFPDDALRVAARQSSQRNLERELHDRVIDVRTAAALVVVVTIPGHAAAVARAIDLATLPEVAGTIAGDDTVFVAISDERTADSVRERLLATGEPEERGSA